MADIDRNSWCSPQEIADCIAAFWGTPDLDPCSNERSIVHALTRYALPQDGLSLPWTGRVYCNPPYSDPGPWVRKCAAHGANGGETIACIIADPSTKWWTGAIWRTDVALADAVCFPDHRVKFIPPPGANVSSMSRPVALPYWGQNKLGFARAFGSLGKVVLL
jgi:hypothetical protein